MATSIRELRSSIDQAVFKYKHAVKAVEDETVGLETVEKLLISHKQAIEIVQLIAQSVQQAVHSRISAVVTSCLEAILDDPYEFCITFERKRNRTEAFITFKRDELEVEPMDAAGGGAVDVAALALRIACLSLKKDARQTLILDEPCKFLSQDLQPRLRPLIEELSQRLGIQFIVVTHMDALRLGQTIDLGDGAAITADEPTNSTNSPPAGLLDSSDQNDPTSRPRQATRKRPRPMAGSARPPDAS